MRIQLPYSGTGRYGAVKRGRPHRMVHFATHVLLAGKLDAAHEPGLTPPNKATEEDDGYLSTSEIAALKRDTDWVILSACNTAAGAATPQRARRRSRNWRERLSMHSPARQASMIFSPEKTLVPLRSGGTCSVDHRLNLVKERRSIDGSVFIWRRAYRSAFSRRKKGR